MVRFLLLLLLVVVPSTSGAAEVERMDGVHVIYLDPDMTTYEAVTREKLIYSRPCILSLPPKLLINKIQMFVKKANYGPFDDNLVRIKLDGIPSGPVYIDAKGGVFIEGEGVSKKLNGIDFDNLKKLFSPIRKPNSCQCMGRWPIDL